MARARRREPTHRSNFVAPSRSFTSFTKTSRGHSLTAFARSSRADRLALNRSAVARDVADSAREYIREVFVNERPE